MRIDILTWPEGAQLAQPFESRKQIDWNDSSDRKWLMNHLHWAMNNDRLVTLSPESN